MNSSDLSPPVPVAIIGMGCMFPKAEDVARYWANIRKGIDAISEVPETHWRVSDYFDENPKAADRTYAHRGGFLTPVDFPLLEFGIAPHSVEATDTTQLLGLMVAKAALADAGCLNHPGLDRDKVSVILGVTGTLELVIPLGARLGHPVWRAALEAAGVDKATTEDVVRRIAGSYVGWQENSFPGLLGNVAAGRIANRLDLRGTNCVVDAACASSLAAVNLAALELATGRCDVAVTGGLDTFNDIFMYMCFSKTPALSPTGDARPFDAQADGTILGEGLGVLVLKRLDDARRDGDRIYAIIRSMGTSSDGKGQAVYAPAAAGQARALKAAYETAGISPATIELVEAHGTGTKVGDAIELAALEDVYRGARPTGGWCALGSVKSQVGHTKAAAGAAGLIKAALALYHKVLPPTSKVREPIESLARDGSPFTLSDVERPWLPHAGHPRRAAVSAFGFGGSNFHCVLEEAEPSKPGVDWDGDVQILAFSGDQKRDIALELENLEALSQWNQVRALAASSRGRFQGRHRYRLLMVAVRGNGDFGELCAAAKTRLESLESDVASPIDTRKTAPAVLKSRAIFAAAGPVPGRLAMLFPGQGSQYVGMLRELACQFPRMQEALALFDDACATGGARTRLSDRIYPPTAYDQAARGDQSVNLRDTQCAQPAIGAVSLGLVRILEDFGVRPELVAGHSFGELTAVHVAGPFDARSLARLAQCRGSVMAECARDQGDGAMLAVFAPAEQVAAFVEEDGLDLVIANKNAPRQCVLSGPKREIERAARELGDRGLSTRVVPVSAAFHSPAVAAAAGPLRETLDTIDVRAAAIPVFANATAAPYPDDPSLVRELLASQLARPVEFVAQIEAMYRAGARTFLEVGPDAKLTGLVSAILEGRDHLALAVDAGRGAQGNLFDLACSLASLASLGYAVDLAQWDDRSRELASPEEKSGLTVKICGANGRAKTAPGDPTALAKPEHRSASSSPKAPHASPPSPRFSLSRPENGAANSHRVAALEIETNWTMNPAPQNHSTHTNGHTNSHASPRLESQGEPAGAIAPGPGPRGAAPQSEALILALRNAQDNLAALGQLAQQTADLHRRFLEGQEQSQQTFLKLLEHENRLALDLLGSTADPAPMSAQAPRALASGHTQPATASTPPGAEPRPLAAAHRNGKPSVPAERSNVPGAVGQKASVAAAPLMPSPADILIAVVADKTGYPADVLDLDMQLDSDLGIDSIKRVEIFSAIQERVAGLPAIEPDQLGSFRTLRAIVEFIGHARSESRQAPSKTEAVAPSGSVDRGVDIARILLDIVAEKTGYPAEMLELDMRLDHDLGIDSIKRVEIFSAIQERLPETPPASAEQIGMLTTLSEIVVFLGDVDTTPTRSHEPRPQVTTSDDRAGGGEPLARALLECVAEKTGYPIEMLELDMRLDADLGIDSIKRVEILSAVQERLPQVGAITPEQLGSLETLRAIVEILNDSKGSSQHVPSPQLNGRAVRVKDTNGKALDAPGHPGDTRPIAASNGIADVGENSLCMLHPVVRPVERGEVRESVRLQTGGTVWVTADGSPLSLAICAALKLRNQRASVIELGDRNLPEIDERLSGLIVIAPSAATDDRFVKQVFRLLRALGPALQRSAAKGGAVLLTVSRLEGTFGFGGLAAGSSPAAGALAGLAKTAGHEWPGVHCKAVDVAAGFDSTAHTAELIVNELFERGPAEVGLSPEGRTSVVLEPVTTVGRSSGPEVRLDREDLVVISGGARGVTAEVALALARTFGPRLVLLGRTPLASAEPGWLAPFRDETQLKRALLERPGSARSLEDVGAETARIMAQREVRHQLARIEDAGSPVDYRSVDVRDFAAVKAVLAEIRAAYGPVRGLIHAAGVLADRRIVDQTDSQFDLVYDTKVNGLYHLYHSIDPEALRFLILFSSSTARFGRSGQVAYAAANEVMNKWAQQQSVRLPDCRVVSYNWGPWAGGMVKESLRRVFEKEGISLIPLEAGAQLVVDGLAGGAGAVEVVVLADPPAPVGVPTTTPSSVAGVAASERSLETVFRRTVDLDALPVLASHVIDGHAVLPMAIIQEWLAEGAMHRNPGLVLCGIDRLQLHKGVIVGKGHDTTVEIKVGKGVRDGTRFVVPTELKGTLANGRETAHARAYVVLADRHEAMPRPRPVTELLRYPLSRNETYESILFHGPAMQGIERIEGLTDRYVAGWVSTSPVPADWIDQPVRGQWLTDPLAIDCAFQLVVLWSRDRLGANSLPTKIGEYRQFRRAYPPDGVRIVAEIRQASETRAVADIEFFDKQGAVVARLDGYECVIDASLNQAFRRNQLVPALTFSRAE